MSARPKSQSFRRWPALELLEQKRLLAADCVAAAYSQQDDGAAAVQSAGDGQSCDGENEVDDDSYAAAARWTKNVPASFLSLASTVSAESSTDDDDDDDSESEQDAEQEDESDEQDDEDESEQDGEDESDDDESDDSDEDTEDDSEEDENESESDDSDDEQEDEEDDDDSESEDEDEDETGDEEDEDDDQEETDEDEDESEGGGNESNNSASSLAATLAAENAETGTAHIEIASPGGAARLEIDARLGSALAGSVPSALLNGIMAGENQGDGGDPDVLELSAHSDVAGEQLFPADSISDGISSTGDGGSAVSGEVASPIEGDAAEVDESLDVVFDRLADGALGLRL